MLSLIKKSISIMILLPFMAFAGPNLAKQLMPDAKLVGEGERQIFVVTVYDAKLFAPKGHFDHKQPYLLSMRYHRDVERDKILDKTFESMEETGFEDQKQMHAWKKMMKAFVPSVKEGDIFSQFRDAQENTVFYFNGKEIGKIADPKFTQHYFAIWLSEDSPLRGLRKKLLNID